MCFNHYQSGYITNVPVDTDRGCISEISLKKGQTSPVKMTLSDFHNLIINLIITWQVCNPGY